MTFQTKQNNTIFRVRINKNNVHCAGTLSTYRETTLKKAFDDAKMYDDVDASSFIIVDNKIFALTHSSPLMKM